MIRVAEIGADLDAYAEVWSAVFPETPMSGAEVRRRLAQREDGRRYFGRSSTASPTTFSSTS